jgi:hypothetical protein
MLLNLILYPASERLIEGMLWDTVYRVGVYGCTGVRVGEVGVWG